MEACFSKCRMQLHLIPKMNLEDMWKIHDDGHIIFGFTSGEAPVETRTSFFLQTDRIFKGHGVCVSSWEVFNWSKGQPEVATPPFKPTVLFVLPRCLRFVAGVDIRRSCC